MNTSVLILAAVATLDRAPGRSCRELEMGDIEKESRSEIAS